MIRARHARFECVVLLLAAGTMAAAEPRVSPGPGQVAQALNPASLVVSPAAEPVPALKYRLLPSYADLNPGDAAPIYLRIRLCPAPDRALESAQREMAEVAECPARSVPGRRGSQVRR